MKLLDHYREWRKMAEKILKEEVENLKPLKFKAIAFTGMGGSGIVGDYVKSFLQDVSRTPIIVVKDLYLPTWIGKDWLVVAVSYSGNTSETLSAVKEALSKEAYVAAVSSGGKLLELMDKERLPYVKVGGGYAPRSALPLLLYASLKLLDELGLSIPMNQVQESLDVLGGVKEAEDEGKSIAEALKGYTPIIVSDVRYEALAWRFKSELNENAKIVAKCETVPESMHNDVEGYEEASSKFKALLLSAHDDTVYTKVLEKFIEELLKEKGFKPYRLELKGKGRLAKLMHGAHVAGFTSLYLAEKRKVEPVKVELIARYRKFLEEALP
ncbi:MAG: bifunctional phosphoglucose/phosphomannose isomerase [Thermoprotei archaeon]|nr:MAG: bifunctional phosphoglucose/phosphomannose isomerase [Thermoprotei archaeon]RLF11923.1 MAG: bifunctional phosphoglucose/phosphomannose isomerase [Thermoprotei archaeon]